MAQGHRLYHDLYQKLSDSTQKQLMDRTIYAMNIQNEYTEDNFIEDLKGSENTFITEDSETAAEICNYICDNAIKYGYRMDSCYFDGKEGICVEEI